MIAPVTAQRSLLQRRNSVTHSLQTMLDGTAVLAIAYYLILHQVGAVTAEYTVFVLLLIGAMAVIYDQFGIYRSNASFTRKGLDLFNAWSLAFGALVLLGFITQNADA